MSAKDPVWPSECSAVLTAVLGDRPMAQGLNIPPTEVLPGDPHATTFLVRLSLWPRRLGRSLMCFLAGLLSFSWSCPNCCGSKLRLHLAQKKGLSLVGSCRWLLASSFSCSTFRTQGTRRGTPLRAGRGALGARSTQSSNCTPGSWWGWLPGKPCAGNRPGAMAPASSCPGSRSRCSRELMGEGLCSRALWQRSTPKISTPEQLGELGCPFRLLLIKAALCVLLPQVFLQLDGLSVPGPGPSGAGGAQLWHLSWGRGTYGGMWL